MASFKWHIPKNYFTVSKKKRIVDKLFCKFKILTFYVCQRMQVVKKKKVIIYQLWSTFAKFLRTIIILTHWPKIIDYKFLFDILKLKGP